METINIHEEIREELQKMAMIFKDQIFPRLNFLSSIPELSADEMREREDLLAIVKESQPLIESAYLYMLFQTVKASINLTMKCPIANNSEDEKTKVQYHQLKRSLENLIRLEMESQSQ